VRIPAAPTLWLQGLHRRYKLAILLIAAWAPVLFPRRPVMAAGILLLATALFLIATRSTPQPAMTESGRAGRIDPHA
jgi:hypothetical protein